MATLLSKTRLPLWAWIVIIVVGSVLIVAVPLIIWRCWYIRRKPDHDFRSENSQTPIKRVTVRRGRLVPQSHYLSLTGSKFGLNHFNSLDEAGEKDKGRSRSPFEWWNTIVDRSQSRQSVMTYTGQSRLRNVYTPDTLEAGPRREKGTNTPTKNIKPEISLISLPEFPPLSTPRMTAYTNFSRSFVPTRQSNGSVPSLLILDSPCPPQNPSTRPRSHRQPKTSSKHPVSGLESSDPDSPPLSTRPPVQIQSFLYSASGCSSDLAHTNAASATTLSLSRSEAAARRSKVPDLPPPRQSQATILPSRPEPARLSLAPAPAAAPPSSLPKPQPQLQPENNTPRARAPALSRPISLSSSSQPQSRGPSYRASSIHEDPADPPLRRDSTNNKPRPLTSHEQRERSQYWETRPDLMPVRRQSKKGNVLRKKSLRRSEMVSLVGS